VLRFLPAIRFSERGQPDSSDYRTPRLAFAAKTKKNPLKINSLIHVTSLA
jgi:hypothetical protein